MKITNLDYRQFLNKEQHFTEEQRIELINEDFNKPLIQYLKNNFNHSIEKMIDNCIMISYYNVCLIDYSTIVYMVVNANNFINN